MELLCRRLS